MSAADKLVFANHDGVGGPPTIDGFAMIDTGVITSEIEGGYINGGRMVLGNSSGLPPVVIQAIRDPANGGTIVLGISCRGDTSFDDIDGVVIGLRPNGGSAAGRQRKIHVFPVWGDAPEELDPDNLGIGHGAADPLMGNPDAHDGAGPDVPQYQIRKNKKPRSGPSYFGRENPGDAWVALNPTGENDPDLFHVRARSWIPPVEDMTPFEAAWSIEVRLPTSNAVAGGTNWLDLADDFGLFVDVIRGGRQVNLDGDGEYFAVHYVFPIGADDLGSVTPSTDIPSASFGHGLMNAAAANGEGVRIKDGALGIGRRPAGSPSGTPLTGEIRVDQPNTMVALLENTGPLAGKITAQVYVAQFGLNGPNDWTPHWKQPTGLENPSAPDISVPGIATGVAGTGETTNDWTVSAADAAFYDANRHQCIWIQLDSADNNVTFAQASVRRNMDFAGFSAITRDITISGDGYPEPADGSGEHEFLLFTRCRKLVVRELVKNAAYVDPATITLVNGALMHDAREKMASPFDKKSSTAGNQQQQWQDTVVYLWITEGFRRTGRKIEINGTKAELLDGTPGDFAICARHEGIDDPMNWAFSGGGMVQHAPGVYGIRVPHKGKVGVKVRLAAGRDERPGDRSDLPKPPRKPRGGGGNDNDGPGTGGDLPKGCLAALTGLFGRKG